MKKRHLRILQSTGMGAAILIASALVCACGSGKQTAKATETATEAADHEYVGMGGADTGIPSERPDETPEETQGDVPNLYYSVYTVKSGDMVSAIATEHSVSQDAIISLNKLKNTRTLQIGQMLKIPSIDGILYTAKKGDTPGSIADKYHVSLEKVALVNSMNDNVVTPGTVMFLPDAKLDRVTLQEINGDLFHRPLHGGYYISSRYGWRTNPFSNTRTFHNGLDMATARGTPIYAALDGVVSATGYDVAYGNYVIITHHSGYQTLYGHMNTILTTRGARVTTATKIGTVGNTGQSTGPHLHFTVFKNRATINPATLLN